MPPSWQNLSSNSEYLGVETKQQTSIPNFDILLVWCLEWCLKVWNQFKLKGTLKFSIIRWFNNLGDLLIYDWLVHFVERVTVLLIYVYYKILFLLYLLFGHPKNWKLLPDIFINQYGLKISWKIVPNPRTITSILEYELTMNKHRKKNNWF